MLVILNKKVAILHFLNRTQVLCLCKTLMTVLRCTDAHGDNIKTMIQMVFSRLGHSDINWKGLAENEISVVRGIVENLEGVPFFLSNIVKQFLECSDSKLEDQSHIGTADHNFNVRDTAKCKNYVDKLLNLMSLSVGDEKTVEEKFELICKNIAVKNTINTLDNIVQDLKKITIEDEMEAPFENKSDPKNHEYRKA